MENDEQREYSISELADEAGVSTRTVRYYVSEGLLPPPLGSGPNSRYTNAHREQLEIIGSLKAQFLPLREIRRRLIGHGTPNASEPVPAAPASSPGPDWFQSRSAPDRAIAQNIVQSRKIMESRTREQNASETPYLSQQIAYSMPPPSEASEPPGPVWRRVAVSDEAELLITESQYRRHQDKIDWLIQWARRVLES